MLAAIGPLGFCLALMAFMPSIWTTALIVLAFFFAYYVYEPPYRGLYPDLSREPVRPLSERAAPLRGSCARPRARRRRLPLPRLAAGTVPRSRPSSPRRPAVRSSGSCRRTARARRVFKGVRAYVQSAGASSRTSRRAAVPLRERLLGGDVRRDADVGRPLHHAGPRPAALDLVGRARHGRGRLRGRGPPLGRARRPVRTRARDLLRLLRLRAGAALRGARDAMARLVLRVHPPRRDRRRAP